MKLKTLKDLEKLCKCDSHCECYEPTPITLRKEAIKHMKDYRKRKLPPRGHSARTIILGYNLGAVNGLKDFFNITDEDLKWH